MVSAWVSHNGNDTQYLADMMSQSTKKGPCAIVWSTARMFSVLHVFKNSTALA